MTSRRETRLDALLSGEPLLFPRARRRVADAAAVVWICVAASHALERSRAAHRPAARR